MIRILPLLMLAGSISLAQKSTFSLEDIMSAPFPDNLVAAPNGSKVAWVFNAQGERNIWAYDLVKGLASQITSYAGDNGHALGNLQFTPDGQHIIFVRGGAPNRRGEIPNPTSSPDGAERAILSVQVSTGEVRKLADGSQPTLDPGGRTLAYINGGAIWTVDVTTDEQSPVKAFSMRGSPASLSWNPDISKRILAFVSRRSTHSYVGLYNFDDQALYYINPSVDNDGSPCWSPDGEFVAFMRQPNQGETLPFFERRAGLPWSIHKASLDGSQVEMLWQADEGPGSVFRGISAANQIFWSASDHIVFPWEKDGWTHLYSLDADGGEPQLLSPGDGEVQYVAMTSDGSVLFSSNIGDINRQHLWRNRPGAPTALVKMTESDGMEWAPVAVGGSIFCLASTGVRPAHPCKLDQNNNLVRLAPDQIPKTFPTDRMVPPEEVVLTATDGMEIHGQLFKPGNYDPDVQYPAVLFFHGGSRRQMLMGFHHRGYYHNAFALNQFMANQGYLVLSVNYRSGIGYGMEFREALNYGANGASEFQDVLGAGLYMKSRTDVDPEKIGLWGGSYGGYLTALGLARASELFAAGVDIHGVHDWNVVIENFVPSYNTNDNSARTRRAFESSPMAHLDGWTSPVLFIHGDDDRNVPFSETVNVVRSMRERDIYFEQLVFPDEVHGFLLHRNWMAAYHATFDFFERFLKE